MRPAYYNEHDRFAAEWLRNLIASGKLPSGDVDERSICDVSPDDLIGYGQAHFFAGIGGWPLALRMAGVPDDAPVWTWSCPCQPFSAAGKRKGKEDERHLWPVFRDIIAARRPEYIFGEQVASAIARGWADDLQSDLESEGYAVGYAVLGAHSVCAPHIRQRLYWGGRLADAVRQQQHRSGDTGAGRRGEPANGCAASWLADADSRERDRITSSERRLPDGKTPGRDQGDCEPEYGCATGRLGDAHGAGSQGRRVFGCKRTSELAAGAAGLAFWSDAEPIDCADGKARLAKPGIFPLANGFSGSRVGVLRAAGNAIVPQVGAVFVTAFLEATE